MPHNAPPLKSAKISPTPLFNAVGSDNLGTWDAERTSAMLSAETCEAIWGQAMLYLPRLGAGLAVFLAFWIGGAAIRRLIHRIGEGRKIDPDVVALLANSAKVGMLLFGAISGLGTLGINVTAMVAGLGLTGIALGLALKEIISNALSGMLLLVYKPFKRNDEIAVLTFRGRVLEVNLRYTLLEVGQERVFIPNTVLLTNAVSVARSPANEGKPATA
jgi:small-conductance mechanosensitive channel